MPRCPDAPPIARCCACAGGAIQGEPFAAVVRVSANGQLSFLGPAIDQEHAPQGPFWLEGTLQPPLPLPLQNRSPRRPPACTSS